MSDGQERKRRKTRQLNDSQKRLANADKNYRENPERSVCVFGEINATLVRQLTPHILKLRKDQCLEPITVYIDSPGGSIQSYEHLEGLLFNENQDGEKCRIITVVTSFAGSAAARLLAKGDYSMAYKNATIHCHGSRFEGGVITKERAESMAEALASFNQDMAKDFAHKIIESLTWLFQFNRAELAEFAKPDGPFQPIHDLSTIIGSKLEGQNSRIVVDSVIELSKFEGLAEFLAPARRSKQLGDAEQKGQGHRDIKLLKLIADFLATTMSDEEKKQGLPKSKLGDLVALYSLRRVYYEKFISDCDDPEPLLMMFCEKDALEKVPKFKDPKERRAFLFGECGHHLFAAWQLATTFSSTLVKGENSLTARDGYWLGLIDEVVGEAGLFCRRQVQESLIQLP